MNNNVLNLFNSVIIKEKQKNSRLNTDLVSHGLILNFNPTGLQRDFLRHNTNHLSVRTLFSKEETKTSTPEQLIAKQILHYVEVYGLGVPGLFDLEFDSGEKVTVKYVSGITEEELGEKVRNILYSNAPFKDSSELKDIIKEFDIFYDLSQVKNNEMKMLLYNQSKDIFDNGDDAVRFICYTATGSAMLIKSPQVIDSVRTSRASITRKFLENHSLLLAQVFNRHKRIILALKEKSNAAVINRITRLSKKHHVPIREHISKSFIHKALSDSNFDMSVLEKIEIRDKFKYLNLLEFKKLQLRTDSFVIRNGKIHNEPKRQVYAREDIARVESEILKSLKVHYQKLLKGKVIVLDPAVDYGLPVSRKQTVGKLPFGTEVTVQGSISSGIYWENGWGANDLDLYTIDLDGNRVCWGMAGSYNSDKDIVFSGDMTYASPSAMEFMTSTRSTYGLFTNIYSGNNNCQMEIVCGTTNDKNWIEDIIVREKMEPSSRGMITGFVKNNKFIVFAGRLNEKASNFGEKNPILAKASADQWTVKKLFDTIGVKYSVDKTENMDYNLIYSGFSYDKLEELLLT